MAGAVWGIDIGKAALKAVKLRATKEGLEIKAVEHLDYEGPAGEDDKRAEQVKEALKTFLAKHKIGGDTVLVALPGLHAFSRFIKLPPVDAKKIGMMVRMEAQQQIPFPIAEVNWDFQKIEREYAPGEEVEVGIFATQRERVNGFLADLKQHGIEPGVLTVAPLAIFNFVTYNMDLTEATVVLDIGSDHTDLVVVDGPRFWLRNLRIAGNDITKALAERFKVSFDEAEKLKRTASKSDQSKKIFSSMEPTLKDLVTEVTRSVGFFKSQAQGQLDIKKMILLGDGAKLKNLPSFLENELGFPVEKVQKLEQDKFLLDEAVDMELLKRHLLGFGVALGLAIQGVGMAKCAINLAPEDIKVQDQLRRKVPMAAVAVACSWAALGVSYVTWSNWRDKVMETLDSTKALDGYKKIQTDAAAAVNANGGLAKKSDPLKGLVSNRLLPLDLLRKLKDVLPKDNGKIPELTQADRAKPAEQQRDQLRTARQMLEQNRVWVLDLSVEKKPAGPGADPSKPATPDGVYTVTITLAKACAPNQDPKVVRDSLIRDNVKPITEALKGEPFFLKQVDSSARTDWLEVNAVVGDAVVSAGQQYGQLDKYNVSSPTDSFQVFGVDVKFEVGWPTPADPNAQKGGN